MKLKATQLRKGNIIEHNGELYRLTEVFHNTPGKGQASVAQDGVGCYVSNMGSRHSANSMRNFSRNVSRGGQPSSGE